MSEKQREIYDMIIELPEELYGKILDYLDYLKFTTIVDKAPEELIIKDKEDLINKLAEGIKDTDAGNVVSLEEAIAEIEQTLAE